MKIHFSWKLDCVNAVTFSDVKQVQSNFNGSNTFGTMKINSRKG